ncbi:hypothetical protein VNO78_27093 [Psophocarpus tetragonolobus]|uniref:Inositol polyphosphate multikinase n=1 Tax=Psophocarpus tetragonolobus TaxID=3891 RepID=A0AAN9XA20_PSOTE
MLKVPKQRVVGHKAKNGISSPLVDDSGLFYNPLQNNDMCDLTKFFFYSSLSSHPNVPPSFFPAFHNIKIVAAFNGSSPHPHHVLEDLLRTFAHSFVIDVKIGVQTWHLEDFKDYNEKCLKKDKETCTIPPDFRIFGAKVSILNLSS